MLEGFVVPHGHFRIFHGNPAVDTQHPTHSNQFPSILHDQKKALSSTAMTPTDLHLREFAQLEAQIKMLQQQQQTSNGSGNSKTMMAGALVECFGFYTRLMTVESFTWPDFLTAVFTKLAEHFAAASDHQHHHNNVLVRAVIVRIFQESRAHLARVNDASKLISHLMGPLTKSPDRQSKTLVLQLLETMPKIVQKDEGIQSDLLSALSTDKQEEQEAAIAAARAVLPFSTSFQRHIFKFVMQSKSTSLLVLLEHAISNVSEAQQAWNHCLELYHGVVEDQSAIQCIRTMSTIVAAYPGTLASNQVQLIGHVLNHDPRKIVRNLALLSAQHLITEHSDEAQLEGLLTCVLEQLRAENGFMRLKLSGLMLLEKWTSVHGLGDHAVEILGEAKKLHTSKDKRFAVLYMKTLANVICSELANVDGESVAPEQWKYIDELLQFLHPTYYSKSYDVWLQTVDIVQYLCKRFQVILSESVASCLLELIELANDSYGFAMKCHLYRVLGQGCSLSSDTIVAYMPILLKDFESLTINEYEHKSHMTLFNVLFRWKKSVSNDSVDGFRSVDNMVRKMLFASHADQYEVAKLAIRYGSFRLSLDLLAPIATHLDHECFGSWIIALSELCKAEDEITCNGTVTMQAVHHINKTRTYLQAATTSRYGFDFQLSFVELRLEWMQLMLQTHQFAGEITYTNTSAHNRFEALMSRFRYLSDRYMNLRSSLLGAGQTDLDTIQAHGRVCNILSAAIEGFLLLRPSEAIYFSIPRHAAEKENPYDTQNTLMKNCSALERGIREKIDVLQRLAPSRQPELGGKVMQQLLVTVCSMPCVIPNLFFRMSMTPEKRLRSSAQFITYSESSAFTSKPRPRTQVGVPFGTDFTCMLDGVVAIPTSNQNGKQWWKHQIDSVLMQGLVCYADSKGAISTQLARDDKHIYHKLPTQHILIDWNQLPVITGDWCYLPFEIPVHVRAETLQVKGSFVLVAQLAVVDASGEEWPLAATGCRRGFIVY